MSFVMLFISMKGITDLLGRFKKRWMRKCIPLKRIIEIKNKKRGINSVEFIPRLI